MVLHDNGDIFKQMALTHLESKSCRGYIILIISTEFYLIKKSGKGATLMTLLVIFEFIILIIIILRLKLIFISFGLLNSLKLILIIVSEMQCNACNHLLRFI